MITNDQAITLADRWATECQIDGCDAYHCRRCGQHTFGRCSSCDACDLADENGITVGALSSAERASLFAWLRRRAAEYRAGARSVGYEAEPSRDDIAEWIGPDLGEPFESDRGLMLDLLDVALASEREPLPVFETRALSVARLDWPGLLGAEGSP